jgi:hypothetical protein
VIVAGPRIGHAQVRLRLDRTAPLTAAVDTEAVYLAALRDSFDSLWQAEGREPLTLVLEQFPVNARERLGLWRRDPRIREICAPSEPACGKLVSPILAYLSPVWDGPDTVRLEFKLITQPPPPSRRHFNAPLVDAGTIWQRTLGVGIVAPIGPPAPLPSDVLHYVWHWVVLTRIPHGWRFVHVEHLVS